MREDIKKLLEDREHNSREEQKRTVKIGTELHVIHFGKEGDYRDGMLNWPNCDKCEESANHVSISPRWSENGFNDLPDQSAHEVIFGCEIHTDTTNQWYWFHIVPELTPTLHDWNFLVHISEKTWGIPVITWLLDNYRLGRYDGT